MSARRTSIRMNRGRAGRQASGSFSAPPAPPPPGNTTDVVGVGASATDVIAINDANDVVQVGA